MNNLFPDIEDPDINDPDAQETNIPEEEITLPQPGDSEDNYDFKTGNLDEFMNSFQENKEEMPIDIKPTQEEFAEAGKQTIPPATARATGKFIANMIDFSASMGLSLLSGEPRETHMAPEDNKKELASIISEYMKESGGEIPLWAQLVICIIVTYGMQVPGAYMKYKERNGKNS